MPPRTLNPKRRHRRKGLNPHDPAPGNPLHAYLDAYCEWALAAGFSEHTMATRRAAVLRFIVWCDERAIIAPTQITCPVLERYQRTLHQYRKSNGAPLSVIAQLGLLNALTAWFRWMVRSHHLLHNPAADLELPKKPKALPKTILSVPQVETILNQADPATLLGIRNRAVMEVFYSSGIRRMELMGLKLYDLDTERGTLMIRQGKGRKDRFIPIGSRACAWVDKYLVEVRPEIVAGYDDQTLFLDDFGQPMSARFLGDLMRRHVEAAGITTPGACHVFRHAMATHKRGARSPARPGQSAGAGSCRCAALLARPVCLSFPSAPVSGGSPKANAKRSPHAVQAEVSSCTAQASVSLTVPRQGFGLRPALTRALDPMRHRADSIL